MSLEADIEQHLREKGAVAVGFASNESLAGGPPSADLSYVLPGAKAAVSFAIPLDKTAIWDFLSKRDPQPHATDQQKVYSRLNELSEEVADILRAAGYEAAATRSNGIAREDPENRDALWEYNPPVSHRYVAVASGVGTYGWSGCVGTDEHGANLLLCTTVTNAPLKATPPIPKEKSWCDECKACVAICPTEYIEPKKSVSVQLGGCDFEHADRNGKTPELCVLCCSGFTGLSRSKKWSTWSPGRFEVPRRVETPEDKKNIRRLVVRAGLQTGERPTPNIETGDAVTFTSPLLAGIDMKPSCGFCQLVCFGTRAERDEALKVVQASGCVVQHPDGELEALPPDRAREMYANLPPEHRKLYE